MANNHEVPHPSTDYEHPASGISESLGHVISQVALKVEGARAYSINPDGTREPGHNLHVESVARKFAEAIEKTKGLSNVIPQALEGKIKFYAEIGAVGAVSLLIVGAGVGMARRKGMLTTPDIINALDVGKSIPTTLYKGVRNIHTHDGEEVISAPSKPAADNNPNGH